MKVKIHTCNSINELHKLLITGKPVFAIIDDNYIVLGYGRDTNKIKDSISSINIHQYSTKTLSRYKYKEDNFIIANIQNNKFLILTEAKQSSSIDSIIINFILDYLIKLLKEE